MERTVLHDCHSEQVRALIEEHNKVVELLTIMAGHIPHLAPKLPAMIVTTQNRRTTQ